MPDQTWTLFFPEPWFRNDCHNWIVCVPTTTLDDSPRRIRPQ